MTPPPPPTGDMPPEELRRHAHRVSDWIVDYLETLDELPVFPDVEPGELRALLPAEPPEAGEAMEEILDDFESLVVPAVTHWNHPSFFAYFAITGSGPGILGEMLAAALNVNAMVWRSSPAGTELEEHALDWLRRLLGLPEGFVGAINDTASSSSLYALAAAREAAFPEAAAAGLAAAPRGRVYASEHAHSSIGKAVVTLGLGRDGVRAVESDRAFRLRPDALRRVLEEDSARGIRPVAVVATVGTTSTTSVDPVDEVADVCREVGCWLHVDAAYAGPAAMVPELAHHFAGWERADSVVVNPHKWLFTPVDCSVLYCRRPADLKRAFSLTPAYLETGEEATNLMDYGVALGRRFRSLKLWFVLRWFGREGVVARIRDHVAMAADLAERIDAEPGWETGAPHPFSTVVFRRAPEGVPAAARDALNEAVLERVNRSGRAFLSSTRLGEETWLRLAIGNLRTTPDHVGGAWDALRAAAREIEAAGGDHGEGGNDEGGGGGG